MAMNMTDQVRSIAEVANLGRNERRSAKAVEVDVRGELLDLNKTVNGMTESLSDIVTRVVHEVGTEGLLGPGQTYCKRDKRRRCMEGLFCAFFRKLLSIAVMSTFSDPRT
jgi:hypothetical protein